MDDLISRKALKEKLQGHRDLYVKAYGAFENLPPELKKAVDEIDTCISDVVNAEPVGSGLAWVSTKEQLPPVDKRVLTIDKWGHIHDRKLYQYRSGGFVFSPDGMIPGRDVKHWAEMPVLPEDTHGK